MHTTVNIFKQLCLATQPRYSQHCADIEANQLEPTLWQCQCIRTVLHSSPHDQDMPAIALLAIQDWVSGPANCSPHLTIWPPGEHCQGILGIS